MLKAIEKPKGFMIGDMIEKRMQMYPPPADSVLYLPGFPPGGSTIYDKSKQAEAGSPNNGTITGATWVRLPSGLSGLSFNGNDSVACGIQSWTGSISVLCWLKLCGYPWSDTSNVDVLNNRNSAGVTQGFSLRMYHHDVATGMWLRFFVGTGAGAVYTASSGYKTDWVNNTWYHFAGSNNSADKINIWCNTIRLSNDTDAGGSMAANATHQVTIGKAAYFSGWYLLGGSIVALAIVINAPITQATVATHYQQTRHLFGV